MARPLDEVDERLLALMSADPAGVQQALALLDALPDGAERARGLLPRPDSELLPTGQLGGVPTDFRGDAQLGLALRAGWLPGQRRVLRLSNLTRLDGVERLVGLERLRISGPRLHDIEPLGALEELRELSLYARMLDLAPLSGLQRLHTLTLSFCSELRSLAGLPPALQSLTLYACRYLGDLSPLAGLPLTSLRVEDIRLRGRSEGLAVLTELPTLRTLELRGVLPCSADWLRPLTWLTKLHIYRARLDTLEPLQGCQALEHLVLGGDETIDDIDPLAELPRLRVVELSHLTALEDVGPLARAPALEKVELYGCGAVPGVRRLRAAGIEVIADEEAEQAED